MSVWVLYSLACPELHCQMLIHHIQQQKTQSQAPQMFVPTSTTCTNGGHPDDENGKGGKSRIGPAT